MLEAIATSSIMSNLTTLIMNLLAYYLDPRKEIYQQPTKSSKSVHNYPNIDNDLTKIVGSHYGRLTITARSILTSCQRLVFTPISMLYVKVETKKMSYV